MSADFRLVTGSLCPHSGSTLQFYRPGLLFQWCAALQVWLRILFERLLYLYLAAIKRILHRQIEWRYPVGALRDGTECSISAVATGPRSRVPKCHCRI